GRRIGSQSESLAEESEIAAPSVLGRRLAVALVAEILEGVAGAVIGVEFMLLAEPRQFRVDRRHIGRAGILIVLAEEAEQRTANAGGARQGNRLAGRARDVDAAAIKHDGRLVGMGGGAEKGDASAHAMTHHAFAAALGRFLRLQKRRGGFEIGDDLLVIEELDRFRRVFAARPAVIEIGRAGDEAIGVEPLDHAAGEGIDAPAVMRHDDGRERARALRHAHQHVHLAALCVDRNRLDHDPFLPRNPFARLSASTRSFAMAMRAARSTLLVEASGSRSRNHTKRGCSFGGALAKACRLTSSSVRAAPSRRTTKATGFCPLMSSSIGTTAALAIAGWVSSMCSTSPG